VHARIRRPPRPDGLDREDRAFRIVIALKGLDGVLELVGGLLLLVIPQGRIAGLGRFLTQHELSEDPHDVVANLVLHATGALASGHATVLGALYLLSHGAVKVVLVWAVLRNRLWAYPWMIAFLLVFIGYQIYRMAVLPTAGLFLLTVFDLAVTWLTVREYQRNRQRARAGLPVRS
jgi:uncharacterized membrane protein